MFLRLCAAALLVSSCTHSDCRLVVEPAERDFGGVSLGASKDFAFSLYNAGTTDCPVQPALALSAFSVAGDAILVKPGESHSVDVRYTPGSETSVDAATLQFQASTAVFLRGHGLPRAACTDGLKNGNETGVDCGGSCPNSCEGPPCYASTECASGVCAGEGAIPPVFDWSDAANDLAWGDGDLLGGLAALFNDHVELRVRFRETPFDPARSQELTFCLDTDENAATGLACGDGLAGADVVITYLNGELQTHDQIGDPCISNSYDEATKTLLLEFENGRFPRGHLEQQFRYVVLSSVTDASGQTTTDSAPDAPDFHTPGGALSSLHKIALWQANGACCRFHAGDCVGGTCQPPRCHDGVRNGTETGVDCGGTCPAACPD